MMNKLRMVCFAALAFVCTSLRAVEYVVPDYERWPAYTDIHTQVSNALACCQNGDVVTISAGIHELPDDAVTAFNTEKVGAWMAPNFYSGGVTLRGDPAAGRDGVVIRGGATYAVVYARNRALRIEGLTFEDCANGQSRAVVGYQDFSCTWSGLVVSNCVFRGTEPKLGAGVCYATVVDCVFSNCFASSGGAASSCRVFDSVFRANEATVYGGALQSCPVVSNCVFAANAVSQYDGGALAGCGIVADCWFEGNFATRWGGALFGCTDVRDCEFGSGNAVGGVVTQSAGPVSANSSFTRCTFTGNQGNEAGSYTACIFTNMTVAPITCRTNGSLSLTNCLFASSDVPGMFVKGGLLANNSCTIVNCTFVDNRSGDVLLDMKYGEAKNNLFFANWRISGGVSARNDVTVRVATGGGFMMMNNAYGVVSGGLGAAGEGNFQVENPRFSKGAIAGAPYWSLQATPRNRQVRYGGLVEDWMASATDLAGAPRLCDGKVGVGCYACDLNEVGFRLLVR